MNKKEFAELLEKKCRGFLPGTWLSIRVEKNCGYVYVNGAGSSNNPHREGIKNFLNGEFESLPKKREFILSPDFKSDKIRRQYKEVVQFQVEKSEYETFKFSLYLEVDGHYWGEARFWGFD